MKKIIFLTSNELWGDVWFSKHHYANELANLGHTVYFINPSPKWQLKNIFSFRLSIEKLRDNLYTINYNNNFPVFFFPNFFLFLNDQLNLLKLKSLYTKKNNIIWWKFDCYRFAWDNRFVKNHPKIYHVVDPYIETLLDEKLAKNSDLIVCTNKLLYDIYKTKNYKKVIHIPHAFSNENCSIDTERVKYYRSNYDEFILLIGSITKNIDFDLLDEILKNNYTIVLGGRMYPLDSEYTIKWEKLKNHPNFHFIGEVKYSDIQNLICAAKICIVAYKNEGLNRYRVPLKITDYIKQNKPVITTINAGMDELVNKIVFEVNSKEEFCQKLTYLYEIKMENSSNANLINYIKDNSYKKFIDKILVELQE